MTLEVLFLKATSCEMVYMLQGKELGMRQVWGNITLNIFGVWVASAHYMNDARFTPKQRAEIKHQVNEKVVLLNLTKRILEWKTPSTNAS